MEDYKGYTLPNYGTCPTSSDLHRSIIDHLGQSDSGLSLLESIEIIKSSHKYLAVAELMRLNPGSQELRNLHETYVSRLNLLPDEQLYQILISFRNSLTLQQLEHWMNDVSTCRRYVLTSNPRCLGEKAFLFKLVRLIDNIKLSQNLFGESGYISWEKKWVLVCRLTRANSSCPDIKMLPVIYFRALKSDNTVNHKKIKEDIEFLMTAEERKLWNKIVSRRGLISDMREWEPYVWISLIQLAVGFYGLVSFLGGGDLNHVIGVAISFFTMMLIVALIRYIT